MKNKIFFFLHVITAMMTKNLLHQKANEMVDMINNPIYPFFKEHSVDKDEYPGGLEMKTEPDKIELNEI